MKKSILSISVFSLILLSCFFQACKKPRCPEDPCKNPVKVMAVERDLYYMGHFITRNNDNTEVYLCANNWDQYASRVIPGRQYKISYKEVACQEKPWCIGDHMDIRTTYDLYYPTKCINITCFEEVPRGCFETLLNPQEFDEVYNQASATTSVNGNSLNVRVGFSGCSPDEANFSLYAREIPDMSPRGNRIWVVKAVNMSKGITCQAYFTKDICFDLSSIKKYYRDQNLPYNDAVIRMEIGTETREFTYKF